MKISAINKFITPYCLSTNNSGKQSQITYPIENDTVSFSSCRKLIYKYPQNVIKEELKNIKDIISKPENQEAFINKINGTDNEKLQRILSKAKRRNMYNILKYDPNLINKIDDEKLKTIMNAMDTVGMPPKVLFENDKIIDQFVKASTSRKKLFMEKLQNTDFYTLREVLGIDKNYKGSISPIIFDEDSYKIIISQLKENKKTCPMNQKLIDALSSTHNVYSQL